MRFLRLLLLAAGLALVVPAAAHAVSIGVDGGVLRVAADGTGTLQTSIASLPGPCHYPTQGGALDDAAGCVLFSQSGAVATGAGCAHADAGSTWFDDHPDVPVRLWACGLSGVSRIDVAGGPKGDELTFDPAFSVPVPVPVAVSVGQADTLEARDQTGEAITCTGETFVFDIDAQDRASSCAGIATADEQGGSIAVDGSTLRYQVGIVKDFMRSTVEIGYRAPEESREGLLPGALRIDAVAKPTPGDGCAFSDEWVLCGVDPIRRVEIVAPTRQSLRLKLDLPEASTYDVHVTGGSGGDELDLRDGVAETIDTCGAGSDSVYADAVDTVAGDCEYVAGTRQVGTPDFGSVLRGQPIVGTRVVRGSGTAQAARLVVRCPRSAEHGCGGVLQVDWAHGSPTRIGEMDYWVAAGRTKTVDVAVGHGLTRAYYHDRPDPTARFMRERKDHVDVVVRQLVGPHQRETRLTLRGFERVG
jgi:hypothetical protein